jgi:hypothetical protein
LWSVYRHKLRSSSVHRGIALRSPQQ